MQDYKKAVGMRMLELRKNQKKSQAEVAKHLELTVAAYQNYETGRREAGYKTLTKLAEFYGVTTDYLLGREPQVNPFLGIKPVDDDEFIKLYSALPEEAKKAFVDVMAQLAKAQKPSLRKSTTYTCGELEDKKKAEADEAKDAG